MRVEDYAMAVFYKDQERTILENPSAIQLSRFINRSGFSCLRGILTDEGELYVWDADHMTHSDVECEFGTDGMRIDVSEGGVTAVLAGGAHELMLPAENLEAFFERHGYPGSTTLDDLDVIEKICEVARDTMRSHKTFARRPREEFHVDIDPRCRYGQRNLAIVAEGLVPLARTARDV